MIKAFAIVSLLGLAGATGALTLNGTATSAKAAASCCCGEVCSCDDCTCDASCGDACGCGDCDCCEGAAACGADAAAKGEVAEAMSCCSK